MPQFGTRSRQNLVTCDSRLQRVFDEVIKHVDCSILCGSRSKEEQEELYRTGKSKVRWPKSKHNSLPSKAVDAVPYPIDWNNKERFYLFAGFVKGVAADMGIKIRLGADWDGDFNPRNQSFHDLPHFELDED